MDSRTAMMATFIVASPLECSREPVFLSYRPAQRFWAAAVAGSATATPATASLNRRPRFARISLQREHEQKRLVALLPELRNELVLAAGTRAQAGQNRDILLAVDLERHGRRIEAGADIDLPKLLQRHVVIGREGPIGETREYHAAGR